MELLRACSTVRLYPPPLEVPFPPEGTQWGLIPAHLLKSEKKVGLDGTLGLLQSTFWGLG